MTPKQVEQVRTHIAKDELKEALAILQTALEGEPKLKEVIHQSGRLANIEQQIRLGVVGHENASITTNKIRYGLLGILDEIGLVTGSRTFNESLTRAIIESIQAICPPAKRFAGKVAKIEHWEAQQRISDVAKGIIADSFVGVIGIQLSKLMAIGKEENSDLKKQKYLQKCIHLANHSLDLVNFVLLSKLWDVQQNAPQFLEEKIHEVIATRFENGLPPSAMERWELLGSIHQLFVQYDLEFPIIELQAFGAELEASSGFQHIIEQLQILNTKLDSGKEIEFSDCLEAEQQIAHFFAHFAFLVKYNMASIKNIGYREIRNGEAVYLHRFTALGIDSKANIDAEQIIGMQGTVHTDAVLFYKGEDYTENSNLYPFVIDYNTLTAEQGAKICFFQRTRIEDDNLEYLFLEDGSFLTIGKESSLRDDLKLGELMMDAEKRKIFNLNCVVSGFEQARRDILADF